MKTPKYGKQNEALVVGTAGFDQSGVRPYEDQRGSPLSRDQGFMKTLKQEEIHTQRYRDRADRMPTLAGSSTAYGRTRR